MNREESHFGCERTYYAKLLPTPFTFKSFCCGCDVVLVLVMMMLVVVVMMVVMLMMMSVAVVMMVVVVMMMLVVAVFFSFITYVYKSSVYLKQCCNLTMDKKITAQYQKPPISPVTKSLYCQTFACFLGTHCN